MKFYGVWLIFFLIALFISHAYIKLKFPRVHELTFALQALPHEAPQQGATVVTEGGHLVVVDAELMGHVNAEPLGTHLQRETHARRNMHTVLQRGHCRIMGGIMHAAQVLDHTEHTCYLK